mmetsp:Transcript_624/g.868  ORF Transcript_624/g.868 Transcript_624/m.868 type:complete len:151 (-) Transcript_624:351-803(-)
MQSNRFWPMTSMRRPRTLSGPVGDWERTNALIGDLCDAVHEQPHLSIIYCEAIHRCLLSILGQIFWSNGIGAVKFSPRSPPQKSFAEAIANVVVNIDSDRQFKTSRAARRDRNFCSSTAIGSVYKKATDSLTSLRKADWGMKNAKASQAR